MDIGSSSEDNLRAAKSHVCGIRRHSMTVERRKNGPPKDSAQILGVNSGGVEWSLGTSHT